MEVFLGWDSRVVPEIVVTLRDLVEAVVIEMAFDFDNGCPKERSGRVCGSIPKGGIWIVLCLKHQDRCGSC